MRQVRFDQVRNPLRLASGALLLALLTAGPAALVIAQEPEATDAAVEAAEAAEATAEAGADAVADATAEAGAEVAAEVAAEAATIGEGSLLDAAADAAAVDGPLAPEAETEAPLIEAKVQPILTEADFASVPEGLHPQLEAINATVEQLSNDVRATRDAAALRNAAKTAMSELQAIRRSLQFHGIRVEDRGGELIDIVEQSIGVEASGALGAIIGDALTIERGLRYCLDLFPNTCHQRLRGDLTQLSEFDPSKDLELPEGKTRIASTDTLGLGALVVAYLPDPKAPVEKKPALTGDDELDAQRRSNAVKSHQEAMEDFLEYRIQVQDARRPHTTVNYALATGDLIDIVTVERDYTDDKGEKAEIRRDPTKHVRGPSDPSDDVTPGDLWALLVKLDEEEAAFRTSLVGSAAETATE